MDFEFSAEQVAIRDTIRELVQDRVAPRAAEIDQTGEYPKDIEKLFAENGLLGIPFPEEYGGISGSSVTICMGIEEIAKACASSSLILAVQALGSYPILVAGTEEQKKRLCPPLASGEKVAAYALSEPGSGSDAAAMTTRATKHGNEYVLNGTKSYVTNGPVADVVVVYAMTDRKLGFFGLSCFVVERGQPGMTLGGPFRRVGLEGSPAGAVYFEDCRIPAAQRVGEEGQGAGLAGHVADGQLDQAGLRLDPGMVAAVRAVRRAGSTRMPCIGERSSISPPSQTAVPATLCPPPRTETGRPCSRAKRTARSRSSCMTIPS